MTSTRPRLIAQAVWLYYLLRDMQFSMRDAAVLLVLNVIATIFESIGIGILLPAFEFIQASGDLAALTARSEMWRKLAAIYGAVGIPITLETLLATSMASILARQLFTFLRRIAMADATYRQMQRLVGRAFDSSLQARIDYMERQNLGAIAGELTVEVNRTVLACLAVVTFVGHLFTFAIYVVLLLAVSPSLTALAAGTMALVGLSMFRLVSLVRQRGTGVSEANTALYTFLIERLRLIRLVRLAHRIEQERESFFELTERQRRGQLSLAWVSALANSVVEPVVVATSLLILYLSIAVFGLRLEQVSVFLLLVLRLLPLMRDLVGVIEKFVGNLPAMTVIVQRLRDLSEAAEPHGGTRPFTAFNDAILFDGVHYEYTTRDGVPALHGVSLRIDAHRMTAVVGPSGSGKSTLIDLIVRLREPTRGLIRIDSVPLADYDIASLRRGIAFLPQTPQILNVRARDHIAYGRPGADMEEIMHAAALAGADEFIRRLPKGYDTMLGEGGIHLSGGERQRIDLARVLLQDARIIIMDEPTSALDADSERTFVEALTRIRRETAATLIVISHRLSTVRAADAIIVLDGGVVIEQGTHDALLQKSGWYAQAVEQQGLGLQEPQDAA